MTDDDVSGLTRVDSFDLNLIEIELVGTTAEGKLRFDTENGAQL
jgi:hypothetical protein